MPEWTPDDELKLRRLAKGGLSYGQMLGNFEYRYTRSAIIGKAHRLGLKRGNVKKSSELNGRNMKRRRRGDRSLRLAHARKPRAAHLAPEPFHTDPDLPPARLVATIDLLPHHCRAVYGEPKDGQHCGRTRVPGTSWCQFHLRRYLPDTALELSRKAETVAPPQFEEVIS